VLGGHRGDEISAAAKVALIAMIMFLMNAILSHATARAVRIREDKHFEPVASEDIPLVAAGEASEPGAQAEK
jgi:multisubunit Na+/H+ antiporter MnhG subunit